MPMSRDYFRPLGLVYGPDAERAVNAGTAGWLAGSSQIAFTLVEVINRHGASRKSEVHPFKALAKQVHSCAAPRATFAGLSLARPQIMGVVNVTPDSFSDGGKFVTSDAAIAHGKQLSQDGAALLDVGGESTRPGSETVAVEEELSRVSAVVQGLAAAGHKVSIDTRKAEVMAAAVAAGAVIVNDVSALSYDAESLATAARLGVPVVLMHAQGDPRTMQLDPRYDDVALDVYDYLEERVRACLAAGIPASHICVDPGIGFGKTLRHNLEIMQQLTLLHGLGVAVLIGVSRKRMIGALSGEKLPVNRVAGSVGGALYAALNGAHIIRVHDVKETAAAWAVASGMASPDVTEF